MQLKQILILSLATATLAGCTTVEPTERAFLAKDHMKLDPYTLDAKFSRHMHFSREGISGGYGADSSGCGCN